MSEPAPDEKEEEFYETNDPETLDNATTTWHQKDEETAEIDTAEIEAQKSYAVFASTTALGGADYSGSAEAYDRFRAHTMPRGSLESPLQKLERLKLETAQLQQYMETAAGQGGFAGQMYPPAVSSELSTLQQQIAGIAGQMSSDTPITASLASSTADKLMQDLSSFTAANEAATGKKGKKASAAAAGAASSVTYELFVEPQAAGTPMNRVADMERRLAALEKATGVTDQVELGKSLSKAVEELHDKVHLLDKGSLSALGASITEVTDKLAAAASHKTELSKQHTDKINTGACPTLSSHQQPVCLPGVLPTASCSGSCSPCSKLPGIWLAGLWHSCGCRGQVDAGGRGLAQHCRPLVPAQTRARPGRDLRQLVRLDPE
eukprot:SAG22_NODE_290_length_12941_cov_3.715465_5_plen_378_part_00